MAEHLSSQNLEQYLERRLSPGELLRADDHLASCAQCRSLAGKYQDPEQLLHAFDAKLHAGAVSDESEHLSYEQIAALVDDGLDRAEFEIAESHLEFCSMCTGEVSDLRAYRASLPDQSTERVRTTDVPAFTNRFAAFARLLTFPPVLRFASAAALVLVLVATVWWIQKRRTTEFVSTVPPTNQEKPDSSAERSPETPAPTGTSNKIVVALNDAGGSVTLDAQGALKGLDSLEPAGQQAVRNALMSGRITAPDSLALLTGKAGTLMGGSPTSSATFSLLSPVGVMIRKDRPTFSWRPLTEASGYIVTVLDSDLRIVATSPQILETTWISPRPLERGGVYSWQVAALKDDQRIIAPPANAPEARFRIIDKNTDDTLRRLESIEARSHLARGILYSQAGLLDDAERELRALVKANPNSEVARKLLLSVRKK